MRWAEASGYIHPGPAYGWGLCQPPYIETAMIGWLPSLGVTMAASMRPGALTGSWRGSRPAAVGCHLFEPFHVHAVGELDDSGGSEGSERIVLAQPVSVWVDRHSVGDFRRRSAGLLQERHVCVHVHPTPTMAAW